MLDVPKPVLRCPVSKEKVCSKARAKRSLWGGKVLVLRPRVFAGEILEPLLDVSVALGHDPHGAPGANIEAVVEGSLANRPFICQKSSTLVLLL